MFYVLEVQRLYTVDDMKAYNRIWLNTGWKEPKQEPKDKDDTVGYLKKIGYMNKRFTTKIDACLYYDNHNPHMRSLNALGTWTSALEPTTRLRYIVRNLYWEYLFTANFELDIRPFSNEKLDRNGAKKIDLGGGDWIASENQDGQDGSNIAEKTV